MKLAVMQPYLFPYIGYFQLIHAVDTFVIYDDVNYINKGWINRNNILLNNTSHRFTLSLEKASQNKKINEINISTQPNSKGKILQLIQQAYNKAPQFKTIHPLMTDIILNEEMNLSGYIQNSLRLITEFLDIQVQFIYSSEINKFPFLKGQEKIMNICRELSATEYINLPGGMDLYNKKVFEENGIRLLFIKSNLIEYKQFIPSFVPNLSIIDGLMFQSKEQVQDLLKEYELH